MGSFVLVRTLPDPCEPQSSGLIIRRSLVLAALAPSLTAVSSGRRLRLVTIARKVEGLAAQPDAGAEDGVCGRR